MCGPGLPGLRRPSVLTSNLPAQREARDAPSVHWRESDREKIEREAHHDMNGEQLDAFHPVPVLGQEERESEAPSGFEPE